MWWWLVVCFGLACCGGSSSAWQSQRSNWWEVTSPCSLQTGHHSLWRRPSHQTWQQSLLWLTLAIPLHPIPRSGSDWSVRARTWHLCSKQTEPSSSQVWMGSVSSPVLHNGREPTAYQSLPTISLPALPAAKPVLTFLPLRCPVRTRHTTSDSNAGRKGHGCWCPASKIKWN